MKQLSSVNSHAVLLDERLGPEVRSTFLVLLALVGYEKFSKYPTEYLQQNLASIQERKASQPTICGRMRLLRLSGWMLRLPGGGYQLQKNALTARQCVERDPKFGALLDSFLERGSKAGQVQAARMRSELEKYGNSLRNKSLEVIPESYWPRGWMELIAEEDHRYLFFCLRKFNYETQQQLLEQLVACCKARQIEKPMHYLYGLARQVEKGLFVFRPPVSG